MCNVIGCKKEKSHNFGDLCSSHWGEIQDFIKVELLKHKKIDLDGMIKIIKEFLSKNDQDIKGFLDH